MQFFQYQRNDIFFIVIQLLKKLVRILDYHESLVAFDPKFFDSIWIAIDDRKAHDLTLRLKKKET